MLFVKAASLIRQFGSLLAVHVAKIALFAGITLFSTRSRLEI